MNPFLSFPHGVIAGIQGDFAMDPQDTMFLFFSGFVIGVIIGNLLS